MEKEILVKLRYMIEAIPCTGRIKNVMSNDYGQGNKACEFHKKKQKKHISDSDSSYYIVGRLFIGPLTQQQDHNFKTTLSGCH